MENLCKLIRVARTILQSLDDFGPARSPSCACEQIPEESFEILLTIERWLGVFPCRRQQKWNSAKKLTKHRKQLRLLGNQTNRLQRLWGVRLGFPLFGSRYNISSILSVRLGTGPGNSPVRSRKINFGRKFRRMRFGRTNTIISPPDVVRHCVG
jgi:hypothetical protein